MANLKAIRVRLSSVKSTRQITSAMKMVAASRLRRAQDRIVQLRPYADKLNEILIGLNQALSETETENIYAPRKTGRDRVLLILLTSNKGLCGGFNANVIRETRRLIADKYTGQMRRGDLFFMPIGKKGNDVLRRLNLNILEEHNDLYSNLSFENTRTLSDRLINLYLTKEFDRIEIIYNQFKNAAVQRLTTEVFLPVSDKVPGKSEALHSDYIYEPDQVRIVEELIPKSLRIQFYKALLDSFAAEHGARMTAMHQATDNATELIRELTLQYNKARQAAITNQLLEVVSGAEALKG
jgi:F-type H+-transporting ATPase subunit gamma